MTRMSFAQKILRRRIDKIFLFLLCLFGSNGILLWILEIKQFNIKDKSRIWWNESGEATWTVGIVWRTGQFCSLALCHLNNTFIPTLKNKLILIWNGQLEKQAFGSKVRAEVGEFLITLILHWKLSNFDLYFPT